MAEIPVSTNKSRDTCKMNEIKTKIKCAHTHILHTNQRNEKWMVEKRYC